MYSELMNFVSKGRILLTLNFKDFKHRLLGFLYRYSTYSRSLYDKLTTVNFLYTDDSRPLAVLEMVSKK